MNRHFSKENQQIANKHKKNAHYHLLLGKSNSRKQWDNILFQWKWHISKILGTISVGGDCDEMELSFTAGRTVVWPNPCGKYCVGYSVNSEVGSHMIQQFHFFYPGSIISRICYILDLLNPGSIIFKIEKQSLKKWLHTIMRCRTQYNS